MAAAWWLRKSRKAKHPEKQQPETSPVCLKDSDDISSSSNDKAKGLDESIPSPSPSRSFIYTSPRSSRELVSWGGGGGFPGVDSDGKEKRSKSLPLPRPSVSSTPSMGSDLVGVNSGSGSTSVSSVSSSGSSDDTHFGGVHRGHGEPNIITRSKSPGPMSRGVTSPLSHLHSRPVGGSSLDSPPARLEEGKNPCHRLPLPPASPTSPSSMYNNIRATELAESANHVPPKWKKGRLLGRGTFGHVYLGFNSENGQMCAMKEVRLISDDQTSKESLKQLNQEISLLSQLSHPNIVQYYGCELGEEALSVYLEYVSGGSIYKLLQEYGAFKEPVIQNYTRKILSGLAYLHGKNTVHRDIKGANILVDPNGEIKLADFGMAKHIAASSSMLSFKGSPYWMAPEVVMNQNGYSLAVDIWSLGCTILEMATSKPPWSQYEGVAAIFKIGNSKDVPEIPEHLSNDAKNFVMLCLQRDPSARPTALELLDHPFVRDQTTCGVASINVTRDITPSTYDGCQSSPDLGLLSHKKIFTSRVGDHKTNQSAVPISRGLKGPRFWGSSKTITSLPVSPCSSPLRRSGPAHQSCFLSPPLPTYAMGHSNYNLSDISGFPTRQNPRYTLGSWREIPQRKT